VGRRVEYRRVPVGVFERLRDRASGEPVHLIEDRARRVLVDLGERTAAEDLLAPEYLEEVELQVAEVALVVTHGVALLETRPGGNVLVGNSKPNATRR
jgi:hypothetical protein